MEMSLERVRRVQHVVCMNDGCEYGDEFRVSASSETCSVHE